LAAEKARASDGHPGCDRICPESEKPVHTTKELVSHTGIPDFTPSSLSGAALIRFPTVTHQSLLPNSNGMFLSFSVYAQTQSRRTLKWTHLGLTMD
jgi:hypothetical protein